MASGQPLIPQGNGFKHANSSSGSRGDPVRKFNRWAAAGRLGGFVRLMHGSRSGVLAAIPRGCSPWKPAAACRSRLFPVHPQANARWRCGKADWTRRVHRALSSAPRVRSRARRDTDNYEIDAGSARSACIAVLQHQGQSVPGRRMVVQVEARRMALRSGWRRVIDSVHGGFDGNPKAP